MKFTKCGVGTWPLKNGEISLNGVRAKETYAAYVD